MWVFPKNIRCEVNYKVICINEMGSPLNVGISPEH